MCQGLKHSVFDQLDIRDAQVRYRVSDLSEKRGSGIGLESYFLMQFTDMNVISADNTRLTTGCMTGIVGIQVTGCSLRLIESTDQINGALQQITFSVF